jgi:chromosome partitioning protein
MNEPTRASSASLQLLRQTYTGLVFSTVIPRNTDIREAHMNKQDIFSYNSAAPAAHAYEK